LILLILFNKILKKMTTLNNILGRQITREIGDKGKIKSINFAFEGEKLKVTVEVSIVGTIESDGKKPDDWYFVTETVRNCINNIIGLGPVIVDFSSDISPPFGSKATVTVSGIDIPE